MNIEEVQMLHPKEGDTIVLRTNDRLTNPQRQAAIIKFREFFPGCQILIFDSGASIEVVNGRDTYY